MGTRSRIGVMHGDKVKSIYCHYDGYLEGVGATLLQHYDSARANHLVALGDASTIGEVIGEEHPFSPFDLPVEFEGMSLTDFNARFGNMCTFYGRDRGESNTEFKVAQTFAEFLDQCDNCGAEFYYIMRDGVWYCGTTYEVTNSLSKKLTVLADALQAELVDQ
jgi:hypothetical protein